VNEVIELYQICGGGEGITIERDFAGPCEAAVDATRLRQVFANLLDNAIQIHA